MAPGAILPIRETANKYRFNPKTKNKALTIPFELIYIIYIRAFCSCFSLNEHRQFSHMRTSCIESSCLYGVSYSCLFMCMVTWRYQLRK